MRIGVIGTGNMGGMLARAFAATTADAELHVYNRTVQKAMEVADGYPNILVARDAMGCVREADIVFVCTKAGDGDGLIREIGPQMTPQQTLVTTISSIPAAVLEEQTSASVAKVIPSIVQTVQSGVLLFVPGPSMGPEAKERLYRLLSAIGQPWPVAESQLRVCSDLTSCGPAFIAELMTLWAVAAAGTGGIDVDQATSLLAHTLVGVAELLRAGHEFTDIVQQVAVPGGVTEAGLAQLRAEGPILFDHLHATTARHGAHRSESSVVSSAHPQNGKS
ncbi:MAG: NAD(P)-binding domain-containing protein [Alicyclobacillus sp.]|nr:NAD(P)-binding domain-containing protein [Alicyclobacillus sp.]